MIFCHHGSDVALIVRYVVMEGAVCPIAVAVIHTLKHTVAVDMADTVLQSHLRDRPKNAVSTVFPYKIVVGIRLARFPVYQTLITQQVLRLVFRAAGIVGVADYVSVIKHHLARQVQDIIGYASDFPVPVARHIAVGIVGVFRGIVSPVFEIHRPRICQFVSPVNRFFQLVAVVSESHIVNGAECPQ